MFICLLDEARCFSSSFPPPLFLLLFSSSSSPPFYFFISFLLIVFLLFIYPCLCFFFLNFLSPCPLRPFVILGHILKATHVEKAPSPKLWFCLWGTFAGTLVNVREVLVNKVLQLRAAQHINFLSPQNAENGEPQNPKSGWAGKFREIQVFCRISTETLNSG